MPTKNNFLDAKVLQKRFVSNLQTVIKKQSYFTDLLVGGVVEAIDGVANNKTAFTVKTSDMPLVIQKYSTDANVAFGTGTAKSTRFGNRQEIIYTDTDMPYSFDWAWNEGLDRHTVNQDMSVAVADRLALQAIEKAELIDNQIAAAALDAAKETIEVKGLTDNAVAAFFREAAVYYTNLGVKAQKVAYLKPELYNMVVDHKLTTSAKQSPTDIGSNEVKMHKGFIIREIPAYKIDDEKTIGILAAANTVKAFTGINTTRTMESEDFDGLAFQGAGKGGTFILDDNKGAFVKVTLGEAATAPGEDVTEG